MQTRDAFPDAFALNHYPSAAILEFYELMKCAGEMWLAYLIELPIIGALEANAHLAARCTEISGVAAGSLLQDAGLRSPTLTD